MSKIIDRMNERLELTVALSFDSVSLFDYKPSIDWSDSYADDVYWTAEEFEIPLTEQIEMIYPYEVYEKKAEDLFNRKWDNKQNKTKRRCLYAQR